jgi:hypothetical protein
MTKLTRQQIHNLATALGICRELPVPAKFRYAIKKNLDSILPELEATREAFPEPDLTPLREALEKAGSDEAAIQAAKEEHKELLERHKRWQADLEAHMKEEVEANLFLADLPEIDDTVNCKDPRDRARQNQALVEALMPIIRV